MIFKDSKHYDLLKLIALLIIPIGTFLSTFFEVWGIPHSQEIMQTFIALDVLCGTFVTISNEAYKRAKG